jgi:LHFPL tetraspan subfamily member protein
MESPSILTFQSIHLNYVRNSRAIAVLWCVFTVCFCIINIVIFMEPWLGATMDTEKGNYLKKLFITNKKITIIN